MAQKLNISYSEWDAIGWLYGKIIDNTNNLYGIQDNKVIIDRTEFDTFRNSVDHWIQQIKL